MRLTKKQREEKRQKQIAQCEKLAQSGNVLQALLQHPDVKAVRPASRVVEQ